MADKGTDLLADSRVAVTRCGISSYADAAEMDRRLATVTRRLEWDSPATGELGALVGPGSRVLVKPNWVLHQNQGNGGFSPLVTHGAVIKAVLRALAKSEAAGITLGDAPVQSCDFEQLLENSSLSDWLAELVESDLRFRGPVDFRRTISTVSGGVLRAERDSRSEENFVLVDLGTSSYLEPVTDDRKNFRVTMYPPELMAATHSPGRHRYLVAREVLEADIIVNLPKLKTHKKAGVTCALKNLVGINGNKEFLPHHRLGGSEDGGDCYPGSSPVKRLLEGVFDVQNSTANVSVQRVLTLAGRALYGLNARMGDEVGVEGSWSGNDTVWRMCLDLNRIAMYGRLDGTLADRPQRRIVHIADAIVAGQGDGPLAPDPLPLGLLAAAPSAAAMDWFGAHLLGYDPTRIPIARNAFVETPWPLVRFGPTDVRVIADDAIYPVADYPMPDAQPSRYPVGWLDAVRPQ